MDAYYASRYTPDANRQIVWPEIVRYLSRFIVPTSTVVDLGAGYCDFINRVTATKKVAVDSSPDFSQYAAPDVVVLQKYVWDIQSLGEASVDVVFASNLLEHLDEEQLHKTMEAIRYVLRPQGTFIAMQPNYRLNPSHYFDDPTHKKVFSDAALESFLISHHFSIIYKMPRFLPFSLRSRPSWIPLSSLLVRLYLWSPLKPFAGQMLFIGRKELSS
jgi:SAM-dependent methyltransferase